MIVALVSFALGLVVGTVLLAGGISIGYLASRKFIGSKGLQEAGKPAKMRYFTPSREAKVLEEAENQE